MASPVADTYSAPSGVPVYGGRYAGGALSGAAVLAGLSADGGMGTQASEMSGAAVLAGVTAGGGMEGVFIPSWVPSTAWQWTDIPGTVWDNYMKTDGTGVAPQITASDPGPNRSYAAQWEYSGPCYSRARHEVYMLGGGHAATTVNAVSRYNLGKNSPDVTLVSAPSSEANRNTYLQNEDWRTTGYISDGKPVSPHSYWNNWYCDSRDEFFLFGISGFATGYPTASGVTGDYWDVAALVRDGGWRAENYYGDVTYSGSAQNRGPRTGSYDGQSLYYWNGPQQDPTVDLRKFVPSTNTHSTVGSSVIPYYSMQADGGSGVALVMGGAGSAAGWQAKFVTLSSGAVTDVTVSGDSIATGHDIFGVQWVPVLGYYVCVWVNSAAKFNGGAVTSLVVATITPTSGSTATASVKTMTGTAPTRAQGFTGVFYDPMYECVIYVPGHAHLLKAIKVN